MTRSERKYRTRCPIHGVIEFNELEKRIVDHPFCQRLRHISQLGFGGYVYLGATHHRLGHSMGMMHLAGKVFDRIVEVDEEDWHDWYRAEDIAWFRQILRLAALLHDSGHPPFSHSAEKVLPPVKDLELPHGWYHKLDRERQATHEDFSIAVVYALSRESPALLSEDQARDVASLIDSAIEPSPSFKQRCHLPHDPSLDVHPLLKHIISGEVDADRMDYLLRDAHYAGVSYGHFDLHNLINGLCAARTSKGVVLVLNQKVVYTYEDFLMARLHMFLQVYFHKTLLLFDHYLRECLQAEELNFKITGSMDDFLYSRDDVVFAELIKAKDKKWASRIIQRKPMKKLVQLEHYHPVELREQLTSTLKQAGIGHLLLTSSSYLSQVDVKGTTVSNTLYVKGRVLGRYQFLPINRVSLLLEQYHQTAQLQYLYCEREDYERACLLLRPLYFRFLPESLAEFPIFRPANPSGAK